MERLRGRIAAGRPAEGRRIAPPAWDRRPALDAPRPMVAGAIQRIRQKYKQEE